MALRYSGLRLLCRACFSLEAGEESGPECDCYGGVGRAKGSAAWKQMVAFFFLSSLRGAGRTSMHKNSTVTLLHCYV